MRGIKNPHAWQKAAGELGTNSPSPHHKASKAVLLPDIIILSPPLLSMWHKRQLRKKSMLATSPSAKARYTKMVQRSFICSWGFMEGAHGSVRCRKHRAAVGLRDGMSFPKKILLDGPKRDPISPQRVGAHGQSWNWPPLQEPQALHEDHQVSHRVPWQQTQSKPEEGQGHPATICTWQSTQGDLCFQELREKRVRRRPQAASLRFWWSKGSVSDRLILKFYTAFSYPFLPSPWGFLLTITTKPLLLANQPSHRNLLLDPLGVGLDRLMFLKETLPSLQVKQKRSNDRSKKIKRA